MHLNTRLLRYMQALSAGQTPIEADPSVSQSLRKQGLIIRGAHGRPELTLNGKQALQNAQKGKK